MLTPDLFLLCGNLPSSLAFCIAVDTAGNFHSARRWPHEAITDLQYAQNGELLIALEHQVPYWYGDSPAVLRMGNDLEAACPADTIQFTAVDLLTTRAEGWSTNEVTIPWSDISADITPINSSIYMIDLCVITAMDGPDGSTKDLYAWPNPFGGRLTVAGRSIDEVHVLDAAGRIVLQRQLPRSHQQQLDLSDLEPGIYLLRIHDGSDRQVLRVVKE